MVKAKKIVIETESHEVFVISINGKSSVRGYCEGCSAEVDLRTIDESVSASGHSALEIFGLIEKRHIHHIETASRHLLICRNSLEAAFTGVRT